MNRKEQAAEVSILSLAQMKQLRILYLRLVKRYHPDTAYDLENREKRKQVMTLINRAYEDRIQIPEWISVDEMSGLDSASGTMDARKQRLAAEMNQLMHTIGNLWLEMNRVKSSRIYRLKQEVKKNA